MHDPLTIYIKLHKLHKPLRYDNLHSIFIFSLVFLGYCAHFCMLIFAQALHAHILVTSMSSGGIIFGTPCPMNYFQNLFFSVVSYCNCGTCFFFGRGIVMYV